jgi:hypothetical protein
MRTPANDGGAHERRKKPRINGVNIKPAEVLMSKFEGYANKYKTVRMERRNGIL